ncbi:MAG TPA: hypothetical protein VG319_05715 [Polyangia bacterium]|jgi:mono/diheme cytochrome c family protein|nr:hypothetical protein [Polyangia bacterium]
MTGMRAHGLLLVTMLAGAAVGGGAGCGNAVPDRPSYERDIKPLMEAHCIRCHGAGGTLNADPDIAANAKFHGAPTNGDFTTLDDVNGHFGLLHYTDMGAGTAVVLKSFVDTLGPMPLPPADPLTSYEHELLFTWAHTPLP